MERYEVSHPDPGVIGFYEKKMDAFHAARKYGPGTMVFDRLARRGAWQLWKVPDEPSPVYMEYVSIKKVEA